MAAAAARRRRRATEEDDEAAIATDDGRGMNDAERRQRRSFIDGHEAMGTATLAETFGKHAGATDSQGKFLQEIVTVKNVSINEECQRSLVYG